MNIRILLPLALAATLGLSSTAAFADGQRGRVIIIDKKGSDRHERVQDRREDRRDTRGETRRVERAPRVGPRVERREGLRRDRRDDRRDDRWDDRDDRRWSHRDDRRRPGVRYYYNARGPEFVRGHHLPRHLRIPQYVVVNPRHHHLSPPPRGHHWVQVGGDYVLVAIATGIIANIIFNH
jgi:Ni/Co efflux regulator RcnB